MYGFHMKESSKYPIANTFDAMTQSYASIDTTSMNCL